MTAILTAVAVERLPAGLYGAERIRPGTLSSELAPTASDAALFIFGGIEPRIQRERAQHLKQVAVASAVDA